MTSSPADATFKLCVVQFKVPGAKNGGSDKGPDGNRIDSIPIANGVIKAGGACDMLLYDYTDHEGFEATIEQYDALIVRINPGQLSQIPGVDGVQAKFDATMNVFVGKGRPVWSSPGVQQKMGAKDALCKIANMGCGLVDTFAYYDAATLDDAALRERLTSATLDCTNPRDSLEMYSNAREVCTLAILARSATSGPAARRDAASRESVDVFRTLDACRASFEALERVLASSAAGERERDAAFDACDAALLEFALRVLACFGFDDARARACLLYTSPSPRDRG